MEQLPQQPRKPKLGDIPPKPQKPQRVWMKYFYPAIHEGVGRDFYDWNVIEKNKDEYTMLDECSLATIYDWIYKKGIDPAMVTITSYIENDEASGVGFRVTGEYSDEEYGALMEKHLATARVMAETRQQYIAEMHEYEVAMAEWQVAKARYDLEKLVVKGKK